MTSASPFASMARQLAPAIDGTLPDVPEALAKRLCEALDSAIEHLESIDAVKVALGKLK